MLSDKFYYIFIPLVIVVLIVFETQRAWEKRKAKRHRKPAAGPPG